MISSSTRKLPQTRIPSLYLRQHFVKIDTFLKCNKVKKLGVTDVKQIVEAVENSEQFQLNEDKTSLRAKKLENLPEFKPKKKVKDNENGGENANPYDNLDVYLLFYLV